MPSIRLSTLAFAIASAATASAALAQNVVFKNTTTQAGANYTIPLQAGQTIRIAPNGNIEANCEIDGAVTTDTRCKNFPAGGGTSNPNAPIVGLSSNAVDEDSNTAGVQVKTGTSFNLTASTGTAEACIRTSSPLVASWNGAVLPAAASGSTSMGSIGQHTFGLKCFNGGGANSAEVVLDAIQGSTGGGGDPTGCAATVPAGFNRVTNTAIHFGTSATNFNNRNVTSLASLYGDVGWSSNWNVQLGPGSYLALQFTGAELQSKFGGKSALTLGMQAMTSTWKNAGSAYVTISKCAGDLRNDVANGDPYRTYAGCESADAAFNNVITFGISSNPPTSGSTCYVDTTSTYYLNIIFANPAGGLSPTETSCLPGDVQCGARVGLN